MMSTFLEATVKSKTKSMRVVSSGLLSRVGLLPRLYSQFTLRKCFKIAVPVSAVVSHPKTKHKWYSTPNNNWIS